MCVYSCVYSCVPLEVSKDSISQTIILQCLEDNADLFSVNLIEEWTSLPWVSACSHGKRKSLPALAFPKLLGMREHTSELSRMVYLLSDNLMILYLKYRDDGAYEMVMEPHRVLILWMRNMRPEKDCPASNLYE